MKQVDKAHYAFGQYESAERFTSYYHQVHATMQLRPRTLLEVGIGNGVFLGILRGLGVNAYGMDIDPDLQPSLCGSVLAIPLHNAAVDVAVACQILEHLPFESFVPAVRELARVSRKGVVISLPESGNAAVAVTLPFVRKLRFAFRAIPWSATHRFDGQHHWEINKRGYSRKRILAAMNEGGLACERTWLNPYNPYHRFFLLRKAGTHEEDPTRRNSGAGEAETLRR